MKMYIDSGYIVCDPADYHRYMLIAYNAEADKVFIFRRAEMRDSDFTPATPEKDVAAEAAGGE